MTREEKIARIRQLNDNFRRSLTGGRVLIAGQLAEADPVLQMLVTMEIRTFTNFNEDNDPYGEHDFVSVDVGGERFFGKIDYYDNNLEYGSPDPSDPSVTTRVLTVFHSSDY